MGHVPTFDDTATSPSYETARPHETDDKNDQTDALIMAIGQLICRWGMMECALETKIATLRLAAGDVPGSGSRTKPTMARMLAELRAIVSMRDRRNAAALSAIADMECDLQRIDRFRGLIVNGFYTATPDGSGFSLRDPKNAVFHHTTTDVEDAVVAIEDLRERFLSLLTYWLRFDHP